MRGATRAEPGSKAAAAGMAPDCLKLRECSISMRSPPSSSSAASASVSVSPTMILSISSCVSSGHVRRGGNGRVVDGIAVLSGGDDDGGSVRAKDVVGANATVSAPVAAASASSNGGADPGTEGVGGGGGCNSNPDHVRQLLARFVDSNASLRPRKKPRYAVRPASSWWDPDDPRSASRPQSPPTSMCREVMVLVFRRLSRRDLVTCMQVSRDWNRWTMDPRLWPCVDASHTRRFSAHHLAGIVRRQTPRLDLGWSSADVVQIRWLCERLPCLRSLSLAGLSWSAVSALRHYSCPPRLERLDVSYVTGLGDDEVRRLVSAPVDGRPGLEAAQLPRLGRLTHLSLAGARIRDPATLALVATRLPHLESLDASRCADLTDAGVGEFVRAGAGTGTGHGVRRRLAQLALNGCPRLTAAALTHLEQCLGLVRVECADSPGIEEAALEAFAARLGARTGRRLRLVPKPGGGVVVVVAVSVSQPGHGCAPYLPTTPPSA